MPGHTSPAANDTAVGDPPSPRRHKLVPALLGGGFSLFLLILVSIQLVPINHSNPPAAIHLKWNSPETETLARRSCLDCHSNETIWTWVSYIAPVSWLIDYEVTRGRNEMNFSAYDVTSPQGSGLSQSGPGDLAYRLGQSLAGVPPGIPSGAHASFPIAEGIAGRLAEDILNGRMPPASYLMFRPSAGLNINERHALLDGLLITLGLDQ